MTRTRSPLRALSFLATLAFLLAPCLRSQDTSTGLAICWPMDDFGATILTNTVSGGPNGTLVNGPLWTNGLTGSGLYFQSNAARPYVNATFDYGLMRSNAETSNWTVAVWFKTLDWPMRTSEAYLWGRVGSHAGLAFLSNAGIISLNYSYRIANGNNSNISLVTNIRNGQWYHTAVVYSNRNLSLYLNGVLVGQRAINASDSCYNFSTAFSLGWINGGQYGFSGALDDFRVYTRPLTALDVAALASPSAAFTNLSNAQEIIPATVLRGTCTPGLSYARLLLSNASAELTNMGLSFDGPVSWSAAPALPLGDFNATLVVSNSNNLGSVTGPIAFTVTTFSTLTVRTVDALGAPIAGGRIFGPCTVDYDGLKTNDTNGQVAFPGVKVGRLVGLTNFAPQIFSGTAALVTNLTMPGSDTTLTWTVDLSVPPPTASTNAPTANPALVLGGRTGTLRLNLAGPGSGNPRLTVTALRLSGGLRAALFDGYAGAGTVQVDLPFESIRGRLSPGVWILESVFRTGERDERNAVVRRQMLFVAE